MHNNSNEKKECCCRGYSFRVEGFILPCLLLILKEDSLHGYQIISKLSELDFLDNVPDPGVVYRHLRMLEDDGLVVSRLEQGDGGPPRKVYSLTDDGETHLESWAAIIKSKRNSLDSLARAIEKYYKHDK